MCFSTVEQSSSYSSSYMSLFYLTYVTFLTKIGYISLVCLRLMKHHDSIKINNILKIDQPFSHEEYSIEFKGPSIIYTNERRRRTNLESKNAILHTFPKCCDERLIVDKFYHFILLHGALDIYGKNE